MSQHKERDTMMEDQSDLKHLFSKNVLKSLFKEDHDNIDRNHKLTGKLLHILKEAVEEASYVILTDGDGVIVYVSEAFASVLNRETKELCGKNYLEAAETEGMKAEDTLSLKEAFETDANIKVQTVHKKKDGSSAVMETSLLHIPAEGTRKSPCLILHKDMTPLIEAEETIKELVTVDVQTGLKNRKQFEKDIRKGVHESKQSNLQTAVMFIDLDRFKFYNDTLGHFTGDKLIEEISKELTLYENSKIQVYRYGGDEFAVIMKGYTDCQQVNNLAQGFLNRFERPFAVKGNDLFITSSIGIAAYPETGKTPDELIHQAEMAMHLAKEKGKGVYQMYFSSLKTRHNEKLQLEKRLRQAVRKKSFTLVYQPQIDLNRKEVVGVEALIRWHDEVLGQIPPNEFIPLAEESGLIISIGDWVLEEACRQAKIWKDEGTSMRMAINISPIQFQRPDFVSKVNTIISKTGLDPSLLDLEITENDLLYNRDECFKTLKRLKEAGIKISIDDFGTGYSSLSYLRRFPIDTLKIDQSFIREVIDNTNDQAIVTSIIQLAHNMKMKVIAEGVETKEMVTFLHDRQCDEMQGYLYSKPLEASCVKSFLERAEPEAVLQY